MTTAAPGPPPARQASVGSPLGDKAVWISWHRSIRSTTLAGALGLPLVALQLEAPALLRHTLSALWTIGVLLRRRPRTIIVQHSFLLSLIVAAYKRSAGPGVTFVADCHTKALRRTVSGPLGALFTYLRSVALAEADLVIVANDGMSAEADATERPWTVMHDMLPTLQACSPRQDAARSRPRVTVVCSYAEDEPVEEIICAIEDLPEADFVLTGAAPKAVLDRIAALAHISAPGFLDRHEYERLVLYSEVVVALTRDPGCLLASGYEALAAGVPLVTSDTGALRQRFGSAAVFVTPDPGSIRSGLRDALRRQGPLREEIRRLKTSCQSQEQEALRGLIQRIRSLGE